MKILLVITFLLTVFLISCKTTTNENGNSVSQNEMNLNKENPQAESSPMQEDQSQEESEENNCVKCEFKYASLVKKSYENLNEEMLSKFLCTFDESCKDDAEFSGYSNEVLFMVLLNEPELTLRTLQKIPNAPWSVILKEIETPIHDGIDLMATKKAIKGVDNFEDTKQKIINAIDVAVNKY